MQVKKNDNDKIKNDKKNDEIIYRGKYLWYFPSIIIATIIITSFGIID